MDDEVLYCFADKCDAMDDKVILEKLRAKAKEQQKWLKEGGFTIVRRRSCKY